MCTLTRYLGFMRNFFNCLVGCFSMIWISAVLSVLYAYVLYCCICACSAQLSMFHMERRSRITFFFFFFFFFNRCLVSKFHGRFSFLERCSSLFRTCKADLTLQRRSNIILQFTLPYVSFRSTTTVVVLFLLLLCVFVVVVVVVVLFCVFCFVLFCFALFCFVLFYVRYPLKTWIPHVGYIRNCLVSMLRPS